MTSTPFRLAINSIPILLAATATIGFVGNAGADAVDLVTHKGFEACWSKALTEPIFLAGLTEPMAGAAGCIPPSAPEANPAYCAASMCNGVPGCPITLESGGVDTFALDVAGGMASFNVSATFEPVSMDATLSGASCTVTVTPTSEAKLQYILKLNIQSDGNFGFYTDSVADVGTVSITGLNSADIQVSGSITCVANSLFFGSGAIAAVANGAQNSLPLIMTADLGESVCPY